MGRPNIRRSRSSDSNWRAAIIVIGRSANWPRLLLCCKQQFHTCTRMGDAKLTPIGEHSDRSRFVRGLDIANQPTDAF